MKKYDVAISFAEEDRKVAERIAGSLKAYGIGYYLYTEQRAANWGEDIFRITLEKYRVEAHFVLALISEDFAKRKWSDIERQLAQLAGRDRSAYFLPLRLDDTAVDGLSSNIVFEVWEDNPDVIADLIRDKLVLQKKKLKKKEKQNGAGGDTYIAGSMVVNKERVTHQINKFKSK